MSERGGSRRLSSPVNEDIPDASFCVNFHAQK